MSLQKNIEYAALVKNQYLPPPLQNNYLSLFDIQVKMAKQFLQGSQQEKVNTIKRRIKKFFDYGNETLQNQLQKETVSEQKKKIYPPLQVDSRKFREGLEIDSSKIIVYGKDLSSAVIDKLFHGFISSQKIDDCNYKLEYVNQKVCQSILYQNLREKTTRNLNRVFNPLQIDWFQIQPIQELQVNQTYARFSTNKDDILFKNDLYFRRLLGKVRKSYDLKRLKYNQQVKQMQETVEFLKINKQKKKRHIFKYKQRKNNHDEHSQTDTNYDGKQYRTHNRLQRSREYQYHKKHNNRKNDYQRSHSNQRNYELFSNLNVSRIKHTPIELQKPPHDTNKPKSPLDQIEFLSKKQPHRGRQRNNKQSMRNNLINQYRRRSNSPEFLKSRNLLEYSYNRDLKNKIDKYSNDMNKKEKYYKVD